MAKPSRRRAGGPAAAQQRASTGAGPASARPPAEAGEVPVVGPRQPCPCGSGRRYKACHGRAAARGADSLVHRPFAGLPGEPDWVALREIVPAATATVALAGPAAQAAVRLATVLPLAWPALRRRSGEVLLGLQVPGGSGDVSADLADALQAALAVDPGQPVLSVPRTGTRLQDLVDPQTAPVVTVHDDFGFWVDDADDPDPEVLASLERVNAAVTPTVRLQAVPAAYWSGGRDRAFLRWVLPYEEEQLLDALARLHAADADRLGTQSRFVGTFRAHGLLVPVWELPAERPAADLEEPVAQFAERLTEALGCSDPLTGAQRRARAGLQTRQLTLR